MNDISFGQLAFEAYCKSVNFVTFDNKPIPKWEALSAQIKQAWEDAANEAIKVYAVELKFMQLSMFCNC